MPLTRVRTTPRVLTVFPMPGSGPCRPRRVIQELTRWAAGSLSSHGAAPVVKPSRRPASDCKGQALQTSPNSGVHPAGGGLHLPQPGHPFPPCPWTGSCRGGQGHWMERQPAPSCLSELPLGPLCSLRDRWLCYQKQMSGAQQPDWYGQCQFPAKSPKLAGREPPPG